MIILYSNFNFCTNISLHKNVILKSFNTKFERNYIHKSKEILNIMYSYKIA